MLPRLKSLFNGLTNRSRQEHDMDDELRSHIERHTDDLVRTGVPRVEAERRAKVEFGGLEARKEECREARGLLWLEELKQDIRYAARLLRKNPAFTAVAVATLALGIGANTAIFSVTNAVLLRSLPFLDPDHLVILEESQGRGGGISVTWPNFLDWREQSRSFEAMAAMDTASFDLSGIDRPTTLRGAKVSAPFFSLIGAKPALGRIFTEADDKPGAAPVVVLGHSVWLNQFGSDAAIIGKPLLLSGARYEVVGVLAPGVEYFSKPMDVYVPVGLSASNPAWMDRSRHFSLRVLARLRPGVSVAAARAEMATISKRLELAYPKTNTGLGTAITSVNDRRLGDLRPALYTLLAAVGLVLLIACANVTNLMLTRQASRQREIAIRAAMGAGRRRVLRQLLTESVLLSIFGGAAGLLLAYWGIPALIQLAPQDIPRLAETRVDSGVILFTFGASVLAGILFGIGPALQASKLDLSGALKESGRGSMSGPARQRLRSGLFVAEVALALVLVIGAGLLIRSLLEAVGVKPGFNPSNVMSVRVALLNPKYRQDELRQAFFQNALERLRAMPGVRAAGAVYCPPLGGDCGDYFYFPADRPAPGPADTPLSLFNVAAPGYFRAMEIPLIEGRDFTDADTKGSTAVIIINQSLARLWWPRSSPLGKQIRYGKAEERGQAYEIVGVVGDVKQMGLDEEQMPEIFMPAAQSSNAAQVLMVRAFADPSGLASAAEREILAIDKEASVRVQTMNQFIAETLARRKFSTLLLAIFGGAALLLALIGVYGVTAYGVSQRTHEIGIRKALGAQASDVLFMVVRQGLLLTLAGIGIGLAGAFAVTRLMQSLLFGVRAVDPLTFAVVPVLVAGVAILAAYLPARRAAKVDPMIALRYE
jgi:putative ABC transport system permease protein